jgi:hypothetical protein
VFELIPERVDIVKRIFRLSTDGVGTYSIVKTLNRDGIPPFGRSNGWNESYIEKIVKNRAVLGEYQPHAVIDGKRRPVGDPVQGYYPAVVSEDEFYAAQAARRARACHSACKFIGRRSGVNIRCCLTGLSEARGLRTRHITGGSRLVHLPRVDFGGSLWHRAIMVFGLFKKKLPEPQYDPEVPGDPEDLQRAMFIQQKGQVGAMFAGRLNDPLEDQADQRARYEHVRDELLGVLDQIEDEFSRGFASHQLIKMCLIANEVALCRALLAGVRDELIREKILGDFPQLGRPVSA